MTTAYYQSVHKPAVHNSNGSWFEDTGGNIVVFLNILEKFRAILGLMGVAS